MKLFDNLLNNNFLNPNILIFGVFTGTASILGYLIFIVRLGSIMIYLNEKFIKLSNKFIKKIQQYFRVFRILIMLFILFKFIWVYELILYSLCIMTVILLGYTLYRYRSTFAAISTKMSLIVVINSDIKQITVYPNRFRTEMTNMDTVERKFEFKISNDKIQEIRNAFGPNILNNEITGQNADQIVERYVMPLINASPMKMKSLFLEILNQF